MDPEDIVSFMFDSLSDAENKETQEHNIQITDIVEGEEEQMENNAEKDDLTSKFLAQYIQSINSQLVSNSKFLDWGKNILQSPRKEGCQGSYGHNFAEDSKYITNTMKKQNVKLPETILSPDKITVFVYPREGKPIVLKGRMGKILKHIHKHYPVCIMHKTAIGTNYNVSPFVFGLSNFGVEFRRVGHLTRNQKKRTCIEMIVRKKMPLEYNKIVYRKKIRRIPRSWIKEIDPFLKTLKTLKTA